MTVTLPPQVDGEGLGRLDSVGARSSRQCDEFQGMPVDDMV